MQIHSYVLPSDGEGEFELLPGTTSFYSFIVTLLDIQAVLPKDLWGGHVLRRARPEEIEFIRKRLQQDAHGRGWPAYDYKMVKDGYGYSRFDLPSDEWKYWVIAINADNNYGFNRIAKAAALLTPSFSLGFDVFFDQLDQMGEVSGGSATPLHIVEYLSTGSLISDPAVLTEEELEKLNSYIALEDALKTEHDFIKHALNNYMEIKRVSPQSDMLIVGYFSILESLITHKPRMAESLDSINHQVRNKAVLLRKRFARPLLMEKYFSEQKEIKLWEQLYKYRSDIAHGSSINFQNSYKNLESRERVLRFLEDYLKALLVLALNEPDFLSDLKAC